VRSAHGISDKNLKELHSRDQGFDATIIKWILVEDCTALNWFRIKSGVGKFLDNTAVGIATGNGLDDQGVGVRVPAGSRIFTSPCHPDRLWGPPNFLSSGYRGSFPGGKADGAGG
jgi:hypothetical protein